MDAPPADELLLLLVGFVNSTNRNRKIREWQYNDVFMDVTIIRGKGCGVAVVFLALLNTRDDQIAFLVGLSVVERISLSNFFFIL